MPTLPDGLEAGLAADAGENDPRLDHPWAVWAVLRGGKSWLFRRGIPPTLLHPRWTVRLLRLVTLMGLLGTISTAVIAVEVGIEQVMDASGASGFRGFGLMLFPGITFGLFVLVPLSRWQGRNWWLTIPAVPISAAVYFGAEMAFLEQYPIMSSQGNIWAAAFCAGLAGGAGLSVWMNPPFSPQAIKMFGLTLLAAIAGSLFFALQFDGSPPDLPMVPEAISRIVAMASLFAPFQVLVAMALGWPLIRDNPSAMK